MRLLAGLLSLVMVGMVLAQPARQVRLPNVERPLLRQADRALDQVAELRRAARSVEADARVDLRLLRNWLLTVAANAEPMSDVQATALLRAEDVGVLIALADADQLAADETLHRLTFDLPPAIDAATLQATLRPVGQALARQLATVVVAVDPQPVTDLRRGGLPPAEQLAAIADRLNVSATLRRQLLALAEAATTPRDTRPTQADATGALALVVELADGLARNRAIAAGERLALETRIADGITLFLDPRTVDAGARRLSALRSYRDLIRRVDSLELPQSELAKLAQVLALARGDDDVAAAMLAGLDAFAEARVIVDGLETDVLTPKLARLLGGMRERFEQQRAAVLETAGEVGGSSVFDAPPSAFARVAAEHLELARALSALAEAGAVMPMLEQAGVRPIGGLDQAATSAAVTLGEAADPDALATLTTISALGELLASAEVLEVDPDLDLFLYGRPTQSKALVRQGVIELGSTLAGGGGANAEGVVALRRIVGQWDKLPDVALLRRASEEGDRLSAWPDWPGAGETLGPIVEPYRDALASALVDLAPDGGARLAQVEAELGPMVATLIGAVAAADEVEATDGVASALAGLVAEPTSWAELRRLRALVMYLDAARGEQRAVVLRTWRE